MDLNQDDRGGKTDKHYQFVFSAEGNPQQYHGMSFCNINCGGDGNSSDGGGSCTSRKRIHEASNRSIETPKKKPSTGQGVAPGFAHASLDEVERLLARSMTTLSMQDRERAMEDLHGVRAHSTVSTASSASAAASNDPAATPVSSATILTTSNSIDELANDQRLTEMEVLLQQNSNEAYRLAMTQSPEYVKDSRFRLSFLNTFQTAIAAAQKMLQFLEIKLQHFGSEALCRDLTMDDLDENAKDCLECGFYQYLGRDSGGRRVVGTFPMLLEFKNIVDVTKMEFYWWTSLYPLQDAHDRGLVVVQYTRGASDPTTTQFEINVIKAQHKQFCVMPIKYCAWHIVLGSRKHNSIAFQIIKIISSKALNTRTTFHFGNQMEIQYELRRFGINTDPMTFPVSLNGDINPDVHQRYLEFLRNKETPRVNLKEATFGPEAVESQKLVGIIPTEKDVLFGRGFSTQHHPGNITFRKILEKHYQAYTAADNADKIVLVDHLSSQLRSQLGIRFLKFVTSNDKPDKPSKMWVEEKDNTVIRSKIFQAFRNLRASYRRATEQQQQKHQQL